MKQLLLICVLLFGLNAQAALYIDENTSIEENTFKRVITVSNPDGVKVITTKGPIFIPKDKRTSVRLVEMIYHYMQDYYGWSNDYTLRQILDSDKANFVQQTEGIVR